MCFRIGKFCWSGRWRTSGTWGTLALKLALDNFDWVTRRRLWRCCREGSKAVIIIGSNLLSFKKVGVSRQTRWYIMRMLFKLLPITSRACPWSWSWSLLELLTVAPADTSYVPSAISTLPWWQQHPNPFYPSLPQAHSRRSQYGYLPKHNSARLSHQRGICWN